MIKNYFISIFSLLFYSLCSGQAVVINELDSDTPSTDVLEFVELKTEFPYTSLDGYVLVFYNGNAASSTGNKAYFSLDLSGLTSDGNGIVLVGNQQVMPVPDRIFSDSTIENGADAVALYQGSISSFPIGTLAHQNNLVDVLFHHTNDAPPTELMTLLGGTVQYNETTTTSIQRKSDGTYESKTPTPGMPNDGSGIQYNYITISTPSTQYTEGDSFPITFTAHHPLVETITFSYTLSNGSFNQADYIADTTVTMNAGEQTITKTVQLVDDQDDEGDEICKIRLNNLPSNIKKGNDVVEIEIIDDDYGTSNFGNPLNPTYGNVQNTMPEGYYATLEGKSGNALRQAIQDIIADSTVVRAHNYGDVFNIIKVADRNPENHNHVWLLYKEVSRSKLLQQTTGSGAGKWNREHIYPQSRGGFAEGTSDTPDGINVWMTTSADSLMHAHADAHHIRPEDNQENSSRNNRDYGLTDYNGYTGNHGSWKGDVARALFFMAIRYNGLELVNGNPADSTVGQLGDLATLLQWNHADPADDFEMNRNNYIYTWQYNRNPFIDYPNLADYIWGSQAGQPWYSTLSNPDIVKNQIKLYPNPASQHITIEGISQTSDLIIYNLNGQTVMTSTIHSSTTVPLQLPAGLYLVKIANSDSQLVQKLVIR